MSPWVSCLECQSCTWIPCMLHCCFMPLFDCTQCSSEHVAKLGGSWYSFAWNPPSVFFKLEHTFILRFTCTHVWKKLCSNVEGSWTLTSAKISQAIVVYWGMDSLHHSKNCARNGVARGLYVSFVWCGQTKTWSILKKLQAFEPLTFSSLRYYNDFAIKQFQPRALEIVLMIEYHWRILNISISNLEDCSATCSVA